MEQLNLKSIEVREQITRQEFQQEFLRPNKPVVMKNFSASWPAREK